MEISGTLSFDKGARIDGTVHCNVNGTISKNNLLIIGPSAHIEGDITCHSLVVLGSVTGNMSASYVEIRAGAKIHGDTRYETIEIHQGTEINGRLFRVEGVKTVETPDMPAIMPAAAAGNATAAVVEVAA
ncbi:MAG: polymer-forming cytoskeletal protein [Candidatus Protistobacter heckmanni]|nr:polymer-forming cytoskeletal protein [Candidatus Protistobacter heckmanni]